MKSFVTFFLANFLVLLSLSNSIYAKTDNEYSKKLPTFGLHPSVYLFPLDTNELISADEHIMLKDTLASEFVETGYPASWLSLSEGDKTAFLGISHSQTEDAQNYRDLYKKIIGLSKIDTDLVVIPSLVEKYAKMKGRIAKLDGVSFRILTKKTPSHSGVVDVFDLGSSYDWSGSRIGYSLRLLVFNAKGNWLFTSYAGVSFPDYAIISESHFYRKKRLFSEEYDVRSLKKGVRKSLYPFRKKIKRRK